MTYRVVHINTTSGGGGEVVHQSPGGAAAAAAVGGGGAQGLLGAAGGEVADAQMAYIPSGSTAGDPLATLSATGSGESTGTGTPSPMVGWPMELLHIYGPVHVKSSIAPLLCTRLFLAICFTICISVARVSPSNMRFLAFLM